MTRKLFAIPRIQLPKMQLFFCVLFFFMCSSSFAQIYVSSETKFYVSSGTTIIDDEISTTTEKAVIYVAEGTVLYNFDKIQNTEIIEVKAPEKVAKKIKKLPKKVSVQSAVKNVVPQFYFNTNTSSSVIKEIQHSLSTVVIQEHQQIKAAHLTQYSFQSDHFFYLNMLIGVVLLLAFNLLFQTL